MRIRVLERKCLEKMVCCDHESGMILSALNLFMLGFLKDNPLFPSRAFFWCDGIMGARYINIMGGATKVIRGARMLELIISANSGRSTSIIGSCDAAAMAVLTDGGISVIHHHTMDNLNVEHQDFSFLALDSDFVLLTLPSPKQELVALKLASLPQHQRKTIFCMGGALNMLAHPELECPRYLQVLGLEFAFRLRTDTVRRLVRLFQSFFLTMSNIRYLMKLQVTIIRE